MDTDPSPRSNSATTAIATAVTVVCVLPVFLTGGMAVQLSDDLDLSVTALGFAMSAFVAAQAVLSRSLGKRADRIGSMSALRLAAVIGSVSALLLAFAVRSVVGLTLGLALSGVANALGQPAASRLLSRGVGQRRQGLAFGVFQSSKPIAGLIGGLAVPLVALTVGWRWAYAMTAGAALLLALSLPRDAEPPAPARRSRGERTSLRPSVHWPLVIGAALGFGTVKVFGTFLVDAGVEVGLTPAFAGLVLSGCSIAAVLSRLVVGAAADRREGTHLRAVAVMLALGGVGFVLMALPRPLPFLVGAVMVSLGAWGYNGLFFLSMTRLLAAAPGAITGVMLSSASAGGFLGPLVFGVVVDEWSYTAGWALVGAWALAAGVAVNLADARLAGVARHAEAPRR